MSDDIHSQEPSDFIPLSNLLLLSLEQRVGRLCSAAETIGKTTLKGANNIEALTAQITRLADALDAVSNTLGCVTESVVGLDDVSRCSVRTHSASATELSFRRDEEA